MYYVSRIAGVMALAALAAAGWFAVRLAQADALFRGQTPEAVARASDLMPWNTEYLSFRALQMEYSGEDSTALLERIAALNPLASAPRIRLGLAAEVRGDFSGAQTWLLAAARVDRQFEPRWTLANYYFRRADRGEFWKWMRLALEVSYGDRAPAFDLCWRTSDDPQEILASAIPDRHEVVAAYLSYLLVSRRLAAALPVSLRLAANHSDLSVLLAACEAFLDARDARSAAECWRAERESFGDIAGHGFDWRPAEVPGVSHIVLDGRRARRVVLNGRQPESTELLRKILNFRPGARCLLQWETRTQGLGADSGVEWSVSGQHTRLPSDENWRVGKLVFTARGELQDLVLSYRRPAGQPRAEGYVEIRDVSIGEVK
jgi:tetratricopeptide (TPR) repeat protein